MSQTPEVLSHYRAHIEQVEAAWAAEQVWRQINGQPAGERSEFFHARSLLWDRRQGRFRVPQ